MSAATYYNEFDRGAAAWLRELSSNGLIAQGHVDERSIAEVKAEDLDGYTRCHFFAGIGGWDYALQLAGWPRDRPVWTASCPCQPFSQAGKQEGVNDKRHLWPVLSSLVRESRPDCIFGEQVGGVAGYEWLDGVRADLESQGYTFGAADLAAAGVGAPHIRQRLFWVACRMGRSPEQRDGQNAKRGSNRTGQGARRKRGSGRSGASDGLANTDGRLAGDGGLQRGGQHGQQPQDGGAVRMGDSANERHERERDARGRRAGLEDASDVGGLGDSASIGRHGGFEDASQQSAEVPGARQSGVCGGAGFNPWADCDLIPCRDGKYRRVPRRVESGVQPVVDGLPLELGGMWVDGYGIHPLASGVKGRVGLLRGAGNAIVPQVAAVFIRAFLDATASQERRAAA